jgi:hydrogenase/urease accessory protein HupE
MSTYQKEELLLVVKALVAVALSTFVHMFTVNVLDMHPWIVLLVIGFVLMVVFAKAVPRLNAFAITYFCTTIVWTVVFF